MTLELPEGWLVIEEDGERTRSRWDLRPGLVRDRVGVRWVHQDPDDPGRWYGWQKGRGWLPGVYATAQAAIVAFGLSADAVRSLHRRSLDQRGAVFTEADVQALADGRPWRPLS